MFTMLSAVIQHTPRWVWGVLFALVVLGVRQSFERRVRMARATALPLAFVALSLAGVVSAFAAQGEALAAWALALAGAAALAQRAGPPAGARWLPAERAWQLPGSWLPLALMLGVFALRFVVAALLATHPALHGDAAFAALAGAGYGGASGLFLGRAMTLWRLARMAGAGAAA